MVMIPVVVCAIVLGAAPPATRPAVPPAPRPATRPADPAASRPAAEANPAAEGFDAAGSDPRAIELADATMERMGGRAAWDATRHVAWTFFGARRHVWDRFTGDIRVEGESRDDGVPYVILMNLHTRRGHAWRDGEAVPPGEDLDRMLEQGWQAWVNDSYWLVMPYKLKDSGVTLAYRGEREMADGRPADVLELTFAGVGVTPGNKYEVFIARDTGLVEQWSFYATREERAPAFTTPWSAWQPHGRVLLSGDRGGGRRLTDIAVYEELPASVYRSPAPIERGE